MEGNGRLAIKGISLQQPRDWAEFEQHLDSAHDLLNEMPIMHTFATKTYSRPVARAWHVRETVHYKYIHDGCCSFELSTTKRMHATYFWCKYYSYEGVAPTYTRIDGMKK